MRKSNLLLLVFFLMAVLSSSAQDFNRLTDNGDFTSADRMRNRRMRQDSAKTNTEVPERLKVWRISERFGDVLKTEPDTLQYLFMNTQFTEGTRGEFNTTGNLGSPRQNRIFIDRAPLQQFMFMNPYRYVDTPIDEYFFTNTLSPITNISFFTCGNKTNGEDHIDAKFAANVGKEFGFGMRFNYLYARGYYQNQSTSHFNYTAYCSYLGERYNMHFLFSTNHEKVTENGGITIDEYITHPERYEDEYNTDEIPVTLSNNWNRNDNIHLYLSHRYSLGFNRKVKMSPEEIEARKFALASKKENEALDKEKEARKKAEEEGIEFDEEEYRKSQNKYSGRPGNVKSSGREPENLKADADTTRFKINGKIPADSLLVNDTTATDTAWLKNEYVPVTSFIHTAKFDTYRRIYQAYSTPEEYYAEKYNQVGRYEGDSIYDMTRNYSLKNTVAVALLEGFNKWVPAGLKLFVTSDLRHYTLPDSLRMRSTFNEHHLSIGGCLSKQLGNTLHYDVTAETWLTGEDAGMLHVDGRADMNFRLFGDTLRLDAYAFVHRNNPIFYYRHFQGAHAWWDNDLEKEIHSHIEGCITYPKTNTTLRAAFDLMKDHSYLANSYDTDDQMRRLNHRMYVKTAGDNLSVLTLSLAQKLHFGIFNWDNVITYQKSSDNDALPLPDLNLYSNLYLNVRVAKVLRIHLGADLRYFTKYNAPDYNPYLGQFAVQDMDNKVEIGGCPIINVYANMHLKRTRFFIMYSHINSGSGSRNYFLSPHYPANEGILRFGLSWNFIN